MKNIFRALGTKDISSANEQTESVELDEQDLEQVSGAYGDGDWNRGNDDGDWDYNHDDNWNYHHHRHHHHRYHHHY